MLSVNAIVQIVATTLVATASVTGLAMLALRMIPGGGIARRLGVVLAGLSLSIVVSTIAVAAEMYLSQHDLLVLVWVIGISTVMSLVAAWSVTGRSVRASVSAVIADARRVGEGDVVTATSTGWREFDSVSTELAETSQRLAEARVRIAELDAARRQFFAWISHDLRTPLAGMSAMAEALDEGTARDPDHYIRTIRSKVDTIDHMVSDLFELSTLQTGSVTLRPEMVVLLDLVSDAVADVTAAAAERGIALVDDGIDGHIVWADPRELTRAIGNLLSNSVRYAPSNSTITIRAVTEDDAHLVLSVIDQGEGVSSENLGRIFDVGWRADTTRSHDAGSHSSSRAGAGLGLAIVRGIIEAHGGSVRASNSPAGFQLDLLLPTVAAG